MDYKYCIKQKIFIKIFILMNIFCLMQYIQGVSYLCSTYALLFMSACLLLMPLKFLLLLI